MQFPSARGREEGFIKLAINIIIAIALIGYFSAAIKPFAEKSIDDPELRSKVLTGIDISSFIWVSFIAPPVNYLWQTAVENIIWPTIESHSEDLKDWMLSPKTGVETKNG